MLIFTFEKTYSVNHYTFTYGIFNSHLHFSICIYAFSDMHMQFLFAYAFSYLHMRLLYAYAFLNAYAGYAKSQPYIQGPPYLWQHTFYKVSQ